MILTMYTVELPEAYKILYSFKAIFPDSGVKCHPLGSRKVPYFLPAPKKKTSEDRATIPSTNSSRHKMRDAN